MDFVKKICRTKALNELEAVFADKMEHEGFKYFGYQLFSSPNWDSRTPLILSTYPDEWVDYYVDKKYTSIDPVVKTAETSTEPFLWNDVWKNINLHRKQETFFKEASEYGVSEGIGIPVFSSGHGNAIVTLISDMSRKDTQTVFEKDIYKIALWATHFHYAAINHCSNFKVSTNNAEIFNFTLRELDIIKWSAESKTFSEIGTILGISHNTVMFHVKNIYRKMEVQSRQEMVVKAIMNGIVSI